MNATGEPGLTGRQLEGRHTEWVVVALGSNQGNSRVLLRSAIERLRRIAAQPVLVSSFWRTVPVDCPEGSPDFLNAVVAWRKVPGQDPEVLLSMLQSLERELGRRPKVLHNEPRPLDLDIIAFGNERRQSDQLTLPHPRAVERAFVLYPLAEILPDLVLPGERQSAGQLRDQLGGAGRVMVQRVAQPPAESPGP